MLLLDSHVVVWALDDAPRLGPAARAAITGPADVYVSAASVWELTIKSMGGKIDVPPGLPALLDAAGFKSLPVSAEHADGLRYFPELSRHDPFDRLLLAQARVSGLRLLTADRLLLKLGHDFLVDATV